MRSLTEKVEQLSTSSGRHIHELVNLQRRRHQDLEDLDHAVRRVGEAIRAVCMVPLALPLADKIGDIVKFLDDLTRQLGNSGAGWTRLSPRKAGTSSSPFPGHCYLVCTTATPV